MSGTKHKTGQLQGRTYTRSPNISCCWGVQLHVHVIAKGVAAKATGLLKICSYICTPTELITLHVSKCNELDELMLLLNVHVYRDFSQQHPAATVQSLTAWK